jgi:CRISPR-associated protein Csh2
MNDDTAADETAADSVQNRSEIIFMYDAVDANPNGDPMSATDRPRIDEQTQEAIVTDVRLKRYLRDQLDDDDQASESDELGVYIRKPEQGDLAPERADLFANVLGADKDDIAEMGSELYREFLNRAADVRYFGATFSFSIPSKKSKRSDYQQALNDHVPAHLQGPVQFGPGRSLNEVVVNEEYNSLTSVIATGDDKEQGGYGLADERLKYAFIRFHGIVNENAAEDTRLTEEDVQRLDTLCWRALKNQPLSRSKRGQEPRLYIRVEYEEGDFHAGDLDRRFELSDDFSKPDQEMRSVDDVCLDASEFVDRVGNVSDRIDTIHIATDPMLEVSVNGERKLTAEDLVEHLADIEGIDVNTVDVYAQR